MNVTGRRLLELTDSGLYCPQGDFYIDPWEPAEHAVLTHAHADHARPGSQRYLATRSSERILRHRLGEDIQVQTIDYGESLYRNGVKLSLHPSGHILGSAQVRLESSGQVCVVAGDYKAGRDATCAPYEPLTCHTFISESTFGLPIFKWRPQEDVMADINNWWQDNRRQGKTSLLFAYALGKAQRILAGLDRSIGPIFCHGAVENVNQYYRHEGVDLPETRHVGEIEDPDKFQGAMVIAPPSANSGSWTRRFGNLARAFASGWMQIRGNRRRRAVDRGFVLSDHCDWEELNQVIRATSAEQIWMTHGYAAEMVRWLRDGGLDARLVTTLYSGEPEDD